MVPKSGSIFPSAKVHVDLLYATYNIEIDRGYGVKNLHLHSSNGGGFWLLRERSLFMGDGGGRWKSAHSKFVPTPLMTMFLPPLESRALKFHPPLAVYQRWISNSMYDVSNGQCNYESYIGKSWKGKVAMKYDGQRWRKCIRYIFVASARPSNVCALKFCPL